MPPPNLNSLQALAVQPPHPSSTLQNSPVYASVWRAMGFSGAPPPVYASNQNGLGLIYNGLQPQTNRGVYLAPNVAKALGGLYFGRGLNPADQAGSQAFTRSYSRVLARNPFRSPGEPPPSPGNAALNANYPSPAVNALQTLMHEYVHVAQPRVASMPMREAGAEDYSRAALVRVLGRLGLPNQGSYPDYGIYSDYRKQAQSQPGYPSFLTQSQFGTG